VIQIIHVLARHFTNNMIDTLVMILVIHFRKRDLLLVTV